MADKDFVFLFFKGGDAANGIKHGQPICTIDPSDYPDIEDYGHTLSKHMKKVFLCTKINKSKKQYVDNLFEAGEPKKNKIKWEKIERDLDLVYDIEERLLGPNTIEVLDITNSVEDFVEPFTKNIKFVKDNNAISSGVHTFGPAGDYATRSLLAADLANLTANLTANQIANVTENANSSFTITLNGFSFMLNGNSYITDIALNSDLNSTAFNGPGSASFYNGIYDRSINAASVITGVFTIINTATPYDLCIYDNIFKNGGGAATRQATPHTVVSFYNNIAHEIAIGVIIDGNDGNANSVYEYNTFYNNTYAGFSLGNANCTLNNNVSFNNGSRNFESISLSTGNNNTSSDAAAADGNWLSGSNNQINLVAADEFQSLVLTDPNFLLPVSGGNLNGTGIDPVISGHTTYYNDVSIVLGDVDIGAKGLSRYFSGNGLYYKYW